jgi:hypothetical protein
MTEEKHITPPELVQPLLQLVATALQLNRKDFTVFVDYSGHISKLSIRYYAGGWKPESTYTGEIRVYTDGTEGEAEIDAVGQKLVMASAENELLMEKMQLAKIESERREYERLKAKFESEAA